jgi:hypothetical protein
VQNSIPMLFWNSNRNQKAEVPSPAMQWRWIRLPGLGEMARLYRLGLNGKIGSDEMTRSCRLPPRPAVVRACRPALGSNRFCPRRPARTQGQEGHACHPSRYRRSRQRADDDGADRGHESVKPSCRASVQSRAQGYSLGEAKAQAGPMTSRSRPPLRSDRPVPPQPTTTKSQLTIWNKRQSLGLSPLFSHCADAI